MSALLSLPAGSTEKAPKTANNADSSGNYDCQKVHRESQNVH